MLHGNNERIDDERGQALTSIQVLRNVLARQPKCIEVKA